MFRHIGLVTAATAIVIAATQATTARGACDAMPFASKNATEPEVLTVGGLSGVVELAIDTDPGRAVRAIAGACVGLFSMTDRRLVSATETDSTGHFQLTAPDGDYRLVASREPFLPADQPIHLVANSRSVPLVGRLVTPGIDAGGFWVP